MNIQIGSGTLYQGHCLEVLPTLPDASVQMAIFSPPYWGQRNYSGLECQWGLEATWQEYIQHLRELGQALWRVLKKNGALFIVTGDTYFGGGSGSNFDKDTGSTARGARHGGKVPGGAGFGHIAIRPKQYTSVDKPKQKLLLPERVAIALQEDGWLLRNKILWYKPNYIPSSASDRWTDCYEEVFFFVKQAKYYFNMDAIRREFRHSSIKRYESAMKFLEKEQISTSKFMRGGPSVGMQGQTVGLLKGLGASVVPQPAFNMRVRDIARGKGGVSVQGPLKASEEEVAAYRSRPLTPPHHPNRGEGWEQQAIEGREPVQFDEAGKHSINLWVIPVGNPLHHNLQHWAIYPEELCIEPILACSREGDTVLDPMCGSGTTLVVAQKLDRKFIGIDIDANSIEVARKRLEMTPMPLEVL